MSDDSAVRGGRGNDATAGSGAAPERRRLPRWVSAVLVSAIVALLSTGFLMVILLVIGQVVRPGQVGLMAALRLAIPIFVLSFVIYTWKMLRHTRA